MIRGRRKRRLVGDMTNKVTMQEIADALGISRVTVWKVFHNYENVSAGLRSNVWDKAMELGYVKGGREAERSRQEKEKKKEKERNVSAIVARPDSAAFSMKIIHSLAQELSLYNINLMYTYMPSSYSDEYRMPQMLYNNMVQGAVVLNIYDKRLTEGINGLNLPKVFVDVTRQINPRELSGDLLLLEGWDTMRQITESLVARGMTKIGFIGDIGQARTVRDRYEGFCRCMRERGLPVEEEFCLTRIQEIFSCEEEIGVFLDALTVLPEAFVCASDFIAHCLQLYFFRHRERVPEGIVVTGYDDSDEFTDVSGLLTTASVETEFLGKRIAKQIIYRMESGDAPYETIYVRPSVIYRDSILCGA